MITAVVMPQLGLEVTEGTVTDVFGEVGRAVRKDDPLVALETDKASTDVVAPCDGVIRAIDVAVGDTVPIGAVLLRLADSVDEPMDGASALAAPEQERGAHTRLRAAPVARRAAADLGVALETVRGTGPRGRVTLGDVRNAAASLDVPASDEPVEELTPLRRAIARRMTMSQRIPQYQLVRDVDASHLIAQKEAQAAGTGAPVGVNDLLVQAIAETVVRHAELTAVFVDGENGGRPALQRRDGADVGLAVATEAGLVVPVIRRAHEIGLAEIARKRVGLVRAAREGALKLEELSGATITLSNLGAFGVDRFTAMVNPGESAIVAVGRVVDRLVPRARTIAIVPTLTLTLSFDHRVIDGADGAQALGELAELLEGAMPWRP